MWTRQRIMKNDEDKLEQRRLAVAEKTLCDMIVNAMAYKADDKARFRHKET